MPFVAVVVRIRDAIQKDKRIIEGQAVIIGIRGSHRRIGIVFFGSARVIRQAPRGRVRIGGDHA